MLKEHSWSVVASCIAVGLAGALGAALGGCSAQDQRMSLTYDATKAKASVNGPVVFVLRPIEAHGLPTNPAGMRIMGQVVSSSGERRADVLCQDNISNWVGKAVAGEMRAAGFNTSLQDAARKGASAVATEITEISTLTDTKWSSNEVRAKVRLNFDVTREGQPAGEFESVGEAKVDRAGTLPKNMNEALESALKDAVQKANPKFAEMLGQQKK